MTDVVSLTHPAGRIRVFDGAQSPADGAALTTVRDQVAGLDLAAPAVVLPDFHHKSNMELPSSVVVATADSVRPTLTSASVNCGMALVAFDHAPPGPERNRGVLPSGQGALPLPDPPPARAVGTRRAAGRHGRGLVRGHPVRHRRQRAGARRGDRPHRPGALRRGESVEPRAPGSRGPAGPAPVRNRRTVQPLRRASGRRGGARSGAGRAARGGERTDDAAVPRGRRRARRRDRRALRGTQAQPGRAAGRDGRAEAALPSRVRPFRRPGA